MTSVAEALLLTFVLLSTQASAHGAPSCNSTIIREPRAAIIKLCTPGYPYWLMDKANAPILEEHSGSSYHPQTSVPSAVILEVRLTADNKTLLLNNEAILPLRDPNVPPKITAYQVPANISQLSIMGMKHNGILSGDWKNLTLAWRRLELDYDRLVENDPDAGMHAKHSPNLRFRIMGLGAHARNDVLEPQDQPNLDISLKEIEGRPSCAKGRAYELNMITITPILDVYWHVTPFEQKKRLCSMWSWRCPDDFSLYQEGRPWYRFIWRDRFDQYGRVGSLRYVLVRKAAVLREFWADAGPSMVRAFWFMFTPIALVLGLYVSLMRWYAARAVKTRVRLVAESERLLGEEGACEQFGEEKEEIPPPLPPRL